MGTRSSKAQELSRSLSRVASTRVLTSYRLSPYVIQTILGAVSVVGTVPALLLIETWGRRRVRIHPSTCTHSIPNATTVPLNRCHLGSGLRHHRRARRPFHPRTHRYARHRSYPGKQERRGHPHRLCGPPCLRVLDVLGPDAVGVPRRELPVACAG